MQIQTLKKPISFLVVAILLLSPISFVLSRVLAVSEQYITLSSFAGKPGTTIQVSGGGYTADKYLTIYTSVTNSVLTQTNSNGEFGPVNFTIPINSPQGPLTIVSAITDNGEVSEYASNSYYVEPLTPVLDVTSSSNLPYSTLSIDGTGFGYDEEVNIVLESSSVTVTADANGNFSNVSLTVPAADPGLYNIVATGTESESSTVAYFYISGFYPNMYPSSYYLVPEETLSFGGSGYASGETINVYEGDNPAVLSSFTVDSEGAFVNAGSYVIPFNFAGASKIFKLVGTTSGGESSVEITIGNLNPSITPSAYFLTPGQELSFTGSGFAKNEVVTVYEGLTTNVLSTFNTDETGAFTLAGTLTASPDWANTTQMFRLEGTTSGAIATTSISIGQFYPNATPSSYYIQPGKKVTFTGSGFLSNETVDVFQGLDTTPVTSFVVDADGNFSNAGEIMVPFNQTEDMVFKLFGQLSHGQIEVSFAVGQLYPQISPSTYYIKPGQIFNVTGFGFAEGETVSIRVGDLTPIPSVQDSEGNVHFDNLVLPFGDASTVQLVAIGDLSGAEAVVNIGVAQYYPYIGASEYYVLPGSSISFIGEGFAPNENVTVKVGEELISTLTTDEFGSIETNSIVVPYTASDSITYALKGELSNAANSISIGLASFYAYVSADNYYTQPGSDVTLNGGGFAPNENINVVAGTFNTTAVADSEGNVSGIVVTLPFGHPTETVDITLTGEMSHAVGTTSITLAPFEAQVTPSTYYSQPGSPVEFTGSGFVPGEDVVIKANGTTVQTVTTDTEGAFVSSGLTLPFGTASYTFTGSVSMSVINIDIGLSEFYTSLELSNYYAEGGSAITISGSGFYSNETVNITFGGANVGSAVANAAGAFSLNTNVPYAEAGSKTVIATGVTSGESAETTFTQAQVYSGVELTNYAGSPSTTIGFVGSGFLSNEVIEIKSDRTGDSVLHTIAAGADGSFNNSSFVIPADFVEGNLTLTIKGTYSMTSHEIVFYVTPTP